MLAQHRRSERPETFAVFDLEIEFLLHFRIARIAEDRAIAERTRAEFHAPLEPADGLPVGKGACCPREHLIARHGREARTYGRKPGLYFVLIEFGTDIGSDHTVRSIGDSAWPIGVKMVDRECGSERAARITGSRLNPDIVDRPVSEDLAIDHTIERHSSSKTQILFAGLLNETAGKAHHGVLDHDLNGCRQIHVTLLEPAVGATRWCAEQFMKAIVRHRQAGAIIEIIEIESERAVRFKIDQIVVDELRV